MRPSLPLHINNVGTSPGPQHPPVVVDLVLDQLKEIRNLMLQFSSRLDRVEACTSPSISAPGDGLASSFARVCFDQTPCTPSMEQDTVVESPGRAAGLPRDESEVLINFFGDDVPVSAEGECLRSSLSELLSLQPTDAPVAVPGLNPTCHLLSR